MTVVTGVYIARDASGQVLYVGSSGDISSRLLSHKVASVWWDEAATIERIATDSRHMAYHRERQLIKELDPPHNRMSRGPTALRTRTTGPVVKPRPEALAELFDDYGSQGGLAAAVGVNSGTLNDIWRGVTYPSGKVIARLIVVSGRSFDALFFIGEAEEQSTPEPVHQPPSRLSLADVALMFRCTPATVAGMCRTGRLKALKAGKAWRIDMADVQALLDATSNQASVRDQAVSA